MLFQIQVLMSRDTILTFSYHIANDTWPDEHNRIVASASPDAHCVIALRRHMERFNVTRSSYTVTSSSCDAVTWLFTRKTSHL